MAVVNGVEVYFHSEEDIIYIGQKMKGADLYNLINQGN